MLLVSRQSHAGHFTVDFVLWLFDQGIMPLFTPLSGSYLNMAESIQRILKPRSSSRRRTCVGERILNCLVEPQ